MQTCFANHRTYVLRACVVMLSAFASSAGAIATESNEPSGQWVGNSVLDGRNFPDKTVLTLAADNATLRIEGHSVCKLGQGSYSALENAWSLSFKQADGGDACARLAKGNFSLHPGSKPRTMEFEVTYPGADGSQNRRYGTLSRYP